VVTVPDYSWWHANGRTVKSRLTRAEGSLSTQPSWALAMADKTFAEMEEHGYPDWWHRVQNLKRDAETRVMLAETRGW
jgi:hypothetical protein